MAKKVQSQQMKDAYGTRFSQQDLTDPQENQVPQFLVTPQTKTGGIAFLAALARNKVLKMSGGGTKKTQARDDRKV